MIATTEKARAYGLDAATGAIRWQRSFGTAFKSSTIGCTDLKPNVGSTSTPCDRPLNRHPRTSPPDWRPPARAGSLANAHWFLQALSAATGEERPGFPVEIQGTPYNTPEIPFNEAFQEQRPGLLLLEGVVYVAFASDCDINPYRGIVAGFNASNGEMTTMWSDESGAGRRRRLDGRRLAERRRARVRRPGTDHHDHRQRRLAHRAPPPANPRRRCRSRSSA